MSNDEEHPLKTHLRQQAEKTERDRLEKERKSKEAVEVEHSARVAWTEVKTKLVEEIAAANELLKEAGSDYRYELRHDPQPWGSIEKGHITIQSREKGLAIDSVYDVDSKGIFSVYSLGGFILKEPLPKAPAKFKGMLTDLYSRAAIR